MFYSVPAPPESGFYLKAEEVNTPGIFLMCGDFQEAQMIKVGIWNLNVIGMVD